MSLAVGASELEVSQSDVLDRRVVERDHPASALGQRQTVGDIIAVVESAPLVR